MDYVCSEHISKPESTSLKQGLSSVFKKVKDKDQIKNIQTANEIKRCLFYPMRVCKNFQDKLNSYKYISIDTRHPYLS